MYVCKTSLIYIVKNNIYILLYVCIYIYIYIYIYTYIISHKKYTLTLSDSLVFFEKLNFLHLLGHIELYVSFYSILEAVVRCAKYRFVVIIYDMKVQATIVWGPRSVTETHFYVYNLSNVTFENYVFKEMDLPSVNIKIHYTTKN